MLPDRRLQVVKGHLLGGALLCLVALFLAGMAFFTTRDPDLRTPQMLGGGLSSGLLLLGLALLRRQERYEFGPDGLTVYLRRCFSTRTRAYPHCRVVRSVLEPLVQGGDFDAALNYRPKLVRFYVGLELQGMPDHQRMGLQHFRREIRAWNRAQEVAAHLGVPFRDALAGPVPAVPVHPTPGSRTLRGWVRPRAWRMELLTWVVAAASLWGLYLGLQEVQASRLTSYLSMFGIPVLVLGAAWILAARLGSVVVDIERSTLRVRYTCLGLCLRDLSWDPAELQGLRYHAEHEILRGVSLIFADRILRIGRRCTAPEMIELLQWIAAAAAAERGADRLDEAQLSA